jgi:hypothetical protein
MPIDNALEDLESPEVEEVIEEDTSDIIRKIFDKMNTHPSKINLDKLYKKMQEAVGENGYVTINISGECRKNYVNTYKKEIIENSSVFHIYHDPEDFDFERSYVIGSINKNSDDKDYLVKFFYESDGIMYITRFEIENIPNYLDRLSTSNILGNLSKDIDKHINIYNNELKNKDYYPQETINITKKMNCLKSLSKILDQS